MYGKSPRVMRLVLGALAVVVSAGESSAQVRYHRPSPRSPWAGWAGFGNRTSQAPTPVDALASPRAVAVRGVADSASIGTGAGRIVLYTLPSAPAEGILAAYVPSARLLFVSDVLSPPAQAGQPMAQAGSAELAALVRARGITVERVAGGHGGVASWADVEAAAVRR